MPLTEEEKLERRRASRRAWRERNREAVNAAKREARRAHHDDGMNAAERRHQKRKAAAIARRDAVAEETQIASVSVFPQPEPADLLLSLQRDLQLARKTELQQALLRRTHGVIRREKPLECAMVPPAKDAAFMQGVRYE